jgi:predicted component of type VI protein secretion system
MNLSLVVLAEGPQKGKVLDIRLSQFLVGRDPQCHLRPSSAMISKRHCALIQRDSKVFVRDFDSTNGTFVNDKPVKGEVEVHHEDTLKIGPLLFSIRLQAQPVNRPTPPPPTKAADLPVSPSAMAAKPVPAAAQTPPPATKSPPPASTGSADDDVAALLLSQDDGDTRSSGFLNEVPEGSTVMDIMAVPGEGADAKAQAEKDKAKAMIGNTSSAAKSILEKYMRRPRS